MAKTLEIFSFSMYDYAKWGMYECMTRKEGQKNCYQKKKDQEKRLGYCYKRFITATATKDS